VGLARLRQGMAVVVGSKSGKWLSPKLGPQPLCRSLLSPRTTTEQRKCLRIMIVSTISFIFGLVWLTRCCSARLDQPIDGRGHSVGTSSRSERSHKSRRKYSTPENQIPKPSGEAGHKPTANRPGYDLFEESRLEVDQYNELRVRNFSFS
jgi:hypothetical protein